MHTHPVKQLPTMAINALWCLLIALILLAFPIVARHARLHGVLGAHGAYAPASTSENKVQPVASAVRITQADPTALPR